MTWAHRLAFGLSAIALTLSSSAFAADPGYYKIVEPEDVYAFPGSREKPQITLQQGEMVTSSGTTRLFVDQTWQEVSQGEVTGWVLQNKLRKAEAIPLLNSPLPAAGSCGGFEPGWNLSWAEEEATFTSINGEDLSLPISSAGTVSGFRYGVLQAQGPTSKAVLTVAEEACPFLPLDSFVWGIAHLVLSEEGQPDRVFLGCCRPLPEGFK
ncbi:MULTISPECIES: hypothetical protein [Pseudovibrio]|uniref:hypothetical protein n=1 Tax=Stappiaceae TaxID=2821832 RepID=UPI00236699A2|nr:MULTISPECIES: hypothetical protein [Pseudovibrio]MDD7909311.1 hypothetical protein [Pseudovibrio exalbescens]MDX5594871.1 hypothetical protein [Pseudovibrio sp. SPO723]